MARSRLGSSPAFNFVLTMGVVNLFGDMTYEGGGAINGQFMATLGASAAVVSITAGLGEFLGYSLRSVSGYIADRTGRYWLITFIGYAINLLAVPAMAFAGNWQVAALLILAERIGRAIRKPTVEAMLSYTTGKHGKGWVYGVNTALDETGATLGPLIMALVLLLHGDYRTGYALLLISSVLAIGALTVARMNFPVPSRLEEGRTAPAGGFSRSYWLYMVAAACFAAGLISYELVAYHLATAKVVTEQWIPVFLAFSTGCGVIASLVLGKLYDRAPLPTLLVAVFLSSLFSPFFLRRFAGAPHRHGVLGYRICNPGYPVQGGGSRRTARGKTQSGLRSLLLGVRSRLVDRQRSDRVALRAVACGAGRIRGAHPTHFLTAVCDRQTTRALAAITTVR